ncbi:MAG: hypothetical protein ACK5MI_07365, partial [Mangrovibacterium sp.]
MSKLLPLLVVISFFISCSNTSLNEDGVRKGSDEYVIPNQDDLDFSNTGNNVFPESPSLNTETKLGIISTDIIQIEGNSTSFPLEKIFTLSPISMEDKDIQATDVVYSNGYVFVSYANHGAGHAGGIQIIKLDESADYAEVSSETVSDYIFITDQWFNTHADINMLTVSGNKLYAVGAADVDEGTFA